MEWLNRNGYCVPDLPSIYKQQRKLAFIESQKLKEKDRLKTIQTKQKEDEEDIQDLLDENADIFGENDDTISNLSQQQYNYPQQEGYGFG